MLNQIDNSKKLIKFLNRKIQFTLKIFTIVLPFLILPSILFLFLNSIYFETIIIISALVTVIISIILSNISTSYIKKINNKEIIISSNNVFITFLIIFFIVLALYFLILIVIDIIFEDETLDKVIFPIFIIFMSSIFITFFLPEEVKITDEYIVFTYHPYFSFKRNSKKIHFNNIISIKKEGLSLRIKAKNDSILLNHLSISQSAIKLIRELLENNLKLENKFEKN